MWRKVLNITSWVLLASYLGVSLWYTNERMSRLTFDGVIVNIADSLKSQFVTPSDITAILAKQGIWSVGKKLDEVNRDDVKNTIKTLTGVKDALVYSTPEGTLYIQVWQRTPVMRYIGQFTSFYIDSDGQEMALSQKYSARVLVITGSGDKIYLKDSLFPMVRSIREEAFLDELIEEIAINEDHTLEIIPRIGDQRIFFGEAGGYEWKLSKLKVFYEKGLPNVGWNRYSQIDLRYSNQVVARKWSDKERQIRDSVRGISDTVKIEKPKKKV
jgi:cell division protein FtsQ